MVLKSLEVQKVPYFEAAPTQPSSLLLWAVFIPRYRHEVCEVCLSPLPGEQEFVLQEPGFAEDWRPGKQSCLLQWHIGMVLWAFPATTLNQFALLQGRL